MAGGLSLITLSGTYFRQTDYDTPFWNRPNSHHGRWNQAGGVPTQYWAASPDVAWAERLRQDEITDDALAAELRTPIWAARFEEAGILDLREGSPDGIDLARPELIGPHGPCQELVPSLIASGVRGIIAPSAAIDGGFALTLFGQRVDIGWDESPLLRGEVPATIAAIGAPAPGLAARVHRRRSEFRRADGGFRTLSPRSPL